MQRKKVQKKGLEKAFPHIIPDLSEWPIYKLSEDRRRFVQEINAYALQRLTARPVSEVTDLIARTVYLERIRIKEEPWKVDPPKERQFWKRVQRKLVEHSLDVSDPALAARNNSELLQQILQRYSEEIVGTFRIKTFLFARKFLTFFFNRLLQANQKGFWRFGRARKLLYEKLIVMGDIELVRSLATKGTVVIVPTHFSNLDSILIGYVIDAILGLPSFSYGAGLNLYNTGYTAYFMNRLGAYRVDRRKKNPIYLETLKAMSKLSIERGTNSIFFPGGTRARSGALENKVKLGLLSTTVEAQRALLEKGSDDRIFIVPLVLGYHFVLEAQFLIEQHLKKVGKERYLKARNEFSSLRKILRFTWTVLSEGNEIVFSFGQPMDVLGNPVDHLGHSYDQYGNRIDIRDYFQSEGRVSADFQRESEYTRMLGDRIVERYEKDNVVLSSHLVAFAAFCILKRENHRLDLYGLLRLPPGDYFFAENVLEETVRQLSERLREMAEKGEVRLSEAIYLEPRLLISDGISRLGTFHVKKPLKYDKKGIVISENFLLLYYYHNRLANYGLDRSIRWKNIAFEPMEVDSGSDS